jgi:hypothetical protein
LDLLNDEDVDVVKQAIFSAGQTRCADFVSSLVEMLGDPTTRVPAREALATYGEAILDALVFTMIDERVPMSIRRQLPKVIGMIPHQDSVDGLLSHLYQDEIDMRYKMIRSLGELRAVQIAIQFDANLVEGYVVKGIRDYYNLLVILDAQNDDTSILALGDPRKKITNDTNERMARIRWTQETTEVMDFLALGDPRSRLLRQALQERLELFKEMIFRLLGLVYPPKSMYNAYRGVTSHNRRIRANAVELLDNILSRYIKQMLFPIIDDSSKMAFMEQAAALWAMQSVTEKEAITMLIDGRDNWLRACALYTIGEKRMVELQEYVKEACRSLNPLIRESAELAWRKISL